MNEELVDINTQDLNDLRMLTSCESNRELINKALGLVDYIQANLDNGKGYELYLYNEDTDTGKRIPVPWIKGGK